MICKKRNCARVTICKWLDMQAAMKCYSAAWNNGNTATGLNYKHTAAVAVLQSIYLHNVTDTSCRRPPGGPDTQESRGCYVTWSGWRRGHILSVSAASEAWLSGGADWPSGCTNPPPQTLHKHTPVAAGNYVKVLCVAHN